MTSNINYIKAAQVGVLAISAVLITQGRPIVALFLGILGPLLIEGASQSHKPKIPTSAQFSPPKFKYGFYLLHEFGFRIAPRIDDEIEQEALKDAIAQIQKDYPIELEKYLKYKTVDIASQSEILKYFTTLLTEGTCAGAANSLFDKIVRNQSESLQQSAALVKKEDLFYHQILSYLHLDAYCNIQAPYNVHKKEIAKLPGKEKIAAEKNLKQTKKVSTIKCLRELNRKYHIGTFPRSKKFPVLSSAEKYQNVWETAMRLFPKSQDFVGIFDLPNHMLTIQYGRKGYFLYDSRTNKKGLFAYPDRNIFFRELRYHILSDIHGHFFDAIRQQDDQKPRKKMLEEAEDLLQNQNIHFSIHPI